MDRKAARREWVAASRALKRLLAGWAQHWRIDAQTGMDEATRIAIDAAERRVAKAEEALRKCD